MADLNNDIITVHIADDHQVMIDGLSAVLGFENDMEVIGHSSNGKEVLDWVQENVADIILLDINMPVVSGLEVLEQLKKMQNSSRVIILSSYDDNKLIKDSLKLGAKGFVPKKSAGNYIVQAIRAVSKGEQYFTEDIKDKMMRAMMDKPVVDKENPDGVLINSLFISPSTVETHRKNLLTKINVKNSVGLVLFAVKNKII